MPVRSRYAQAPRPREERRTPYPLKELPQAQPTREPTSNQIKKVINKVGDYLERNQRAYHRDYPNDTTWEQDLCNIPGRVASRSGEFGAEQREDLRSRCRQDPNLVRDIIHPAPPIKFEVKGSKKKKNQQQSSGRTQRRRRSRQPRIIYVERR